MRDLREVVVLVVEADVVGQRVQRPIVAVCLLALRHQQKHHCQFPAHHALLQLWRCPATPQGMQRPSMQHTCIPHLLEVLSMQRVTAQRSASVLHRNAPASAKGRKRGARLQEHVVLRDEVAGHGVQAAAQQRTQQQVRQRLDAHEVQHAASKPSTSARFTTSATPAQRVLADVSCRSASRSLQANPAAAARLSMESTLAAACTGAQLLSLCDRLPDSASEHHTSHQH